MRIVCLLLLATGLLPAQPGIGQNGVVNAASQMPPTLPGGAIARGARFTIYGARLGSMASTKVFAGTAPVNMVSVTPTRIEAIMPAGVQVGKTRLIVKVDGVSTRPFLTDIAGSNPGLFTSNGQGWGPGRILNLASNAPVSLANPARPGNSISLDATGLGNAKELTAFIGSHMVKATDRRPSTLAGEEIIKLRIPMGVEEGCYVPVYLLAGPARASNIVTISIRSGAGPCAAGPVPLLSSKHIGVGVISRTRFRARAIDPISLRDEASLVFADKDEQPVQSPLLLLPPPGTCTAYTSSFQAETILPNSFSSALLSELAEHGIDAGPSFTLRGGDKTRVIFPVPETTGYYKARLGRTDVVPSKRNPGPFLDPGNFILEGLGGTDVGPINSSIGVAAPLEWSNLDELGVIDRSRSLRLRWRGIPASQTVVIVATNVDQLSTAIGTCLCTVQATRGEFTIPAALLANIPVSRDVPGLPYDQLFISSLPTTPGPGIQARGLSGGLLVNLEVLGRVVVYR